MTSKIQTFKYSAAAAALIAAFSSQAQEVQKAAEVTVTAGRIEQQLLDVPMSVSVLTQEEIRNSSAPRRCPRS